MKKYTKQGINNTCISFLVYSTKLPLSLKISYIEHTYNKLK